jgi:hypothetical protein
MIILKMDNTTSYLNNIFFFVLYVIKYALLILTNIIVNVRKYFNVDDYYIVYYDYELLECAIYILC